MPKQDWPTILGLSVFALAAIAIASYMIVTGGPEMVVVAGAILLLAAGQVGLVFVSILKMLRLQDWLTVHQERLHDLSEQADAATARMDDLAYQIASPPAGGLDQIMADIRALRDGFRTLIEEKEAQTVPVQPLAKTPPAVEPLFVVPPPAAPQPQAAPPPRPTNERLELLLEPVIELNTGSTAHYRVLLDLADDNGHVVQHAELMAKADAGGMRPALDAHMVKLVAPILRRLRAKNPGLRAFVPIGSTTLGSREETARILAILEQEVDVASGLVFEFHHRNLGDLDTAGIENLASLGRLGATMALSDVQVSGLDLAALRQLGVRFLSFASYAGEAGFSLSPAWREFMQYARAMQFQIIVSDIATTQQATAAGQIGRFGFGPFFAPPRKVRADAGVTGSQRHARAA